MKKSIIASILLCSPIMATADPLANSDEVTKTLSITGLSEVTSGCDLHSGTFAVEGMQYSDSGNSIKLIQFKSYDGKIFAIPTGLGSAGKSVNEQANQMVQRGMMYFIKFSTCGSGGFMQLIDIYRTYL